MSKFSTKVATVGGSLLAGGAMAEDAVSIPGLADAISTAQSTATAMAGQVTPAATGILFAFAGLIGVYLIYRVFRRGASGR
jgi:Kef-type K+ transport system membrane component KefB